VLDISTLKPNTWLKISFGNYVKVIKYVGEISFGCYGSYLMLEPKSNNCFSVRSLFDYVGCAKAEIMTNEEVVQYYLET
jgi:hypothetical protein